MYLNYYCFTCMDSRVGDCESLGISSTKQVDAGNWQRISKNGSHSVMCTGCAKFPAKFKVYKTDLML